MRMILSYLGAACVCALASLASAQQLQSVPQLPQLPRFTAGDTVDFYSFGRWVPCHVSSPLQAGTYNLHCGNTLELKADPRELRAHMTATPGIPQLSDTSELVSRIPTARSLGGRYGTREPRTCEHRKPMMAPEEARDLFICDSEHEFGGSLYLVSDVNLDVSQPRPYNTARDAAKQGIDPAAPVLDIQASYSNFQCRQIPIDRDNPLDRNCDQFKMTNAAGGCFRNQAGDWHCLMYDFHPGSLAAATNVKPPTLAD